MISVHPASRWTHASTPGHGSGKTLCPNPAQEHAKITQMTITLEPEPWPYFSLQTEVKLKSQHLKQCQVYSA